MTKSKFHLNDQKIDIGYLNKSDLPAITSKREYTREQLEEIRKCRDDIHYFAENYFTIVHVDKGKMLVPLYDYQEDLLNKFQDNRFNIVLTSRQAGKTTTVTIYILHYILFNKDKRVAILANKGKTARMILSRIKLAYGLLPNFLKEPVTEWNKGTIELGNGTRVEATATSAGSISGDSISLLFIDEVAKIENWEEFYSSTYPTISSGEETRTIMVSTANGMNHYYFLWQKALNGLSGFVPTEVLWHQVPGRDEKWKAQQIANTSKDQFLQEHENIFQGAQNTLIGMDTLRVLITKEPIYHKENTKIYERPITEHNYFICVDTGHGKGLNFSVIQVLDITEYPFKQVAVFRDDSISPFLYPNIILKLAQEYNNAWVFIENNDMGAVVASIMNYDFEYEKMINAKDNLSKTRNQNLKYELGVRTTTRTKSIGCSSMKELIENAKLILVDETTITELMTFVGKGKTYQADSECFDDAVMPLVNFSWFTRTPTFDEIFIGGDAVSKELYERQIEEMMNDLPGALFVDNGLNNNALYNLEPGEEIWEKPWF